MQSEVVENQSSHWVPSVFGIWPLEILPISRTNRDQRQRMAIEAADSGQPHADANPFPAGTTKHREFQADYEDRAHSLAAV